jgi:hypothetical protein
VTSRPITMVLPRMFATQDLRLNQYLAAIYDRGFSLRDIANVGLVSYETIRLRLLKAAEEVDQGFIADLSGLPDPAALPKTDLRRKQPVYINPHVKKMLFETNKAAQSYRHGHDPTFVRAFNMMVLELVGQGVPFTDIAEACGQKAPHLRRRLNNWDVFPKRLPRNRLRGQLNTPPGMNKAIPAKHIDIGPEAPELMIKRKYKPGEKFCKWPDCPSHFVGGKCIH